MEESLKHCSSHKSHSEQPSHGLGNGALQAPLLPFLLTSTKKPGNTCGQDDVLFLSCSPGVSNTYWKRWLHALWLLLLRPLWLQSSHMMGLPRPACFLSQTYKMSPNPTSLHLMQINQSFPYDTNAKYHFPTVYSCRGCQLRRGCWLMGLVTPPGQPLLLPPLLCFSFL